MPVEQILYIILGVLGALTALAAVVAIWRRNNQAGHRWQIEDKPAEQLESQAQIEGSTPELESAPDTETTDVPALEAPEVALPEHEVPEAVASRMQRLRSRLAASGSFGRTLLGILSRSDLSEADWEELEETLLIADVGLDSTTALLDNLRTQTKVLGTSDAATIRQVLREELLKLVDPLMDRTLNTEPVVQDGVTHPAAVLMVGVNGTGKTTTVGKLARLLVSQDKAVVLGAADTFRAAAADQLQTWGARVGVPVVRAEREGSDPAAVAFEAGKVGRDTQADVVIVDTAGRLQNKAGLMDELGKIKRVMEKSAPVREVLLVIDATTGQNAMSQAKIFAEVANVSGIVLTKLDGSAKGGIVISVQRELGVPVKFVGLGEGADDFAPFSPSDFVDSLLS